MIHTSMIQSYLMHILYTLSLENENILYIPNFKYTIHTYIIYYMLYSKYIIYYLLYETYFIFYILYDTYIIYYLLYDTYIIYYILYII